MNLYHVTPKETYENHIKKEGLKPICTHERKLFQCDEAIYFTDSLEEAIYFGVRTFEELKSLGLEKKEKKPWVILETNILDIINECKCVSRASRFGYEYTEHEVVAMSKIVTPEPEENIIDFSFDYPCRISPDKLKVIYDSEIDRA